MGNPNNTLFPDALKLTVRSIAEHTQKREEAFDMVEVKLHNIILELSQVIYEKQVNDIVDTAVSRKVTIK
ncbi:MAG: hypothetical protein IMZ47_03165 [Firmicutes bacterium]|nr:hypothetical protein [Bacillota bacterium]